MSILENSIKYIKEKNNFLSHSRPFYNLFSTKFKIMKISKKNDDNIFFFTDEAKSFRFKTDLYFEMDFMNMDFKKLMDILNLVDCIKIFGIDFANAPRTFDSDKEEEFDTGIKEILNLLKTKHRNYITTIYFLNLPRINEYFKDLCTDSNFPYLKIFSLRGRRLHTNIKISSTKLETLELVADEEYGPTESEYTIDVDSCWRKLEVFNIYIYNENIKLYPLNYESFVSLDIMRVLVYDIEEIVPPMHFLYSFDVGYFKKCFFPRYVEILNISTETRRNLDYTMQLAFYDKEPKIIAIDLSTPFMYMDIICNKFDISKIKTLRIDPGRDTVMKDITNKIMSNKFDNLKELDIVSSLVRNISDDIPDKIKKLKISNYILI